MNAFKGFAFVMAAIIFFNTSDCLSEQEIELCVNAHNTLRALHVNTPSLQWDDAIAAKAQAYALKLLKDHRGKKGTKLVHDTNSKGLGENLYWGDNAKPATCPKATLSWYNEIKDYDYSTARSKNLKAVGHFTQVVWRNTIRFGVGIAVAKSRKYAQYGNKEYFIVAKYSPQGNFYMTGHRLRDYTENVQPRKPGAVTPSLEVLDPSPCTNYIGDTTCSKYLGWGIKCDGDYASYMKTKCFKACGHC